MKLLQPVFKAILGNALLLSVIILTCMIPSPTYGRNFMPEPMSISEPMKEPIDVSAQKSLVRLSNGNKEQRFRAYHILRSVEMGALGGVYIVDQRVPALRAKALGKGWWTLLEGRPAMCWMEPAGEKPLIILGKKTATNPSVLDAALVQAYIECGFRELEVTIMKDNRPCVTSTSMVALINEELGIDYGVRPGATGVTHFSMPPAMYAFEVECEGKHTDPFHIFKAVAPGAGIQYERFDF